MTQVGSVHCIGLEALEQALAAGALPDAMREHLAVCEQCREQEAMVRENLEFMGGVADRLGSDVLALPPRSLLDPALLPGYELVREVARGGQGVVYEAIQIETKRRVAIKLIEAGEADGRTRRRVEREAELAASLRHPNIVSLFQRTVLPDGRQALAMEYVQGVAIDEWARAVDAAAPKTKEGERTALRVKLRAVSTVCDALQHAHVNGVIHRDLKPANVLVTGNGTPRIVDFGIARRVESETRITRTGAFAGTLAYASPEQVSGQPGMVDIRSDVYSLGLMLYEVLTGRRPYDTAGSLSGAIANITRTPPSPLGTIQPGDQPAGEELESIIEKALAKDRGERYQSAAALRNDIDNYLGGRPVEARHHSTVYLLKKLAQRHRVAVIATTGVILLLAAFAAIMAWSSGRLARQRTLLEASLSSSTIERGRLMGLNGEHGRAEAMIWPEMIRTGADLGDTGLLFRGPPEVVQAAWALVELYSRHPSVSKVPVSPGMEVLCWKDDGATVMLVRADGSTEVRDVRTGKVLRSQERHEPPSQFGLMVDSSHRRALIHQPGGSVVIDGDDHVIRLGGEGFEDRVYDISTDGSRALALSANGTLTLCATDPLAPIRQLATSLSAQTRPRFTCDGRWVAAGVGDEVRLWRVTDGVEERRLKVPAALWSSAVRASVTSARLRPDGKQFAVGVHDTLLLYPNGVDGDVRQIEAHRGFIGWIEYSTDGSTLLTTGSERNFKTWDPESGELLATFEQVTPPRGAIAMSGDGSLVACCDQRNWLGVFETRPRKWLRQIAAAENSVHCVRFSPDGKTVAAASADGKLTVWDPKSGSLQWSTEPSRDGQTLEAMCFSPDGSSVYVGGQGGSIRVGRVGAAGTLEEFVHGAERVTWLGCSPNGNVLAAAGGSPEVELFDVESRASLRKLKGHGARVIEATFGPRGDTLYSVGADGLCIAWDLDKGTERFRTEQVPATVRAVCLSPDGSTIATGCDDWNIRLWDAKTGQLKRKLSGAKQHVFGLAYHPTGNILFSCNRDSVVQVWDARTGRELAVLDGHSGLVLSLAVSPDGQQLVTGASDRTVGVWDLSYYRRHLSGCAAMWETAPALTADISK